MTRLRLRVLAGSLLLCLTACVQTSAIEGTWGLDSITVDGESMALPPEVDTLEHEDVAAWIRFDGDVVDGELPCNAFMGDYQLDGSVITWEVVQDSGLCLEPVGVMEVEEPMTTLIFTPTVDVTVDDTTLVLSGSGVVMTFSPLDD